jgi:hypothetical protein
MGLNKTLRKRYILSWFFASMIAAPAALGDSKGAENVAMGNSPSASASAAATIIQPPRANCDRALYSLSINARSLGGEDNHPYGPMIVKCYMKGGRLQIDLIVGDNSKATGTEATGITDIPVPAMTEPPKHSQITNHRPADGPAYQQRIIEFTYNYE